MTLKLESYLTEGWLLAEHSYIRSMGWRHQLTYSRWRSLLQLFTYEPRQPVDRSSIFV